jgi:hypothetical protein
LGSAILIGASNFFDFLKENYEEDDAN